ncbi:hypothetical protein [Salegentibacter sp. Hel_I_6]|uniref:hypothetical protein n=1 Tax=Salegentibacter sp. Hel_I_6 TaxID=1250278 RepID=UPI00056AFE20|nr:hypothetical protein [Salegentibacter sp. Hel_I_6]
MEKKIQLIENLNKYDEVFTEKENIVTIKTPEPLIFHVDFSKSKIQIYSELKGFNLLTGIIGMKFEKVLGYISIMLILFMIIFLFPLLKQDGDVGNTQVIISIIPIITVICWTCLYYLNYRFKYENYKNRIIEWTK